MSKRKLLVVTLVVVMALSTTIAFAGEWVIFKEALPAGALLDELHADSQFAISSENPYAGTNHLKRDIALGSWAWITGISSLNLDLTGIVYEEAYIEFYIDSGATAVGYMELRIAGPGWDPDNGATIATDGEVGYEQIKVMLTDFAPDLDTFTGGTNSIDRWSVGFGAASDLYVDEVVISDGILAAISPKHKLAGTWGKLKSSH